MDGALDTSSLYIGRRLIPHLVDDIALADPARTFAAIPRSSDLSQGWKDISFAQVAQATNRCARLIEQHLGRNEESQAVFYLGPTDIRHLFVFLGIIKTGHVPQFSSHRNSLDAHLSLLQKSAASSILLADDAPAVSREILAQSSLRVISLPSLEELLEPGADNQPYLWNESFDSARYKTACILHTSGSTGIPKPIFVAHGTFASNDSHQLIQSLGGQPIVYDTWRRKRIFMAFPPYHAACVGMLFGYTCFNGLVCVMPPPVPLTLEIVEQAHKFGEVQGTLLPPSVLTDLYKSSPTFENTVQGLDFVAYVGGVLADEVGSFVTARTKLITLMGSTESMWLPVEIVADSKDWKQIPISPFLGHEYRPAREDLKELFMVRKKNLELFQGIFCTFPDKDEWGMKDLYTQHPRCPRFWSFAARGDDLICFSNAEKLNPITIEAAVSTDPLVSAAVVGGHGQFQACLLVEPKTYFTNPLEEEKLIDDLWPTVREANRSTVAHGRIMKNFIIFTDPDRPLPRAGKDTVQRFAALQLYADDMKTLYQRAAQDPDAQEASHGSPLLEAEVQGKQAAEPDALQSETPSLVALANKVVALADRVEYLFALFNERARGSASVIREPSAQSRCSEETLHDHSPTTPVSEKNRDSLADLKKTIFEVVSDNVVVYGLTDTADLYGCGLDSLQTLPLVSAINKALTSSSMPRQITSKDVRSNPSIEKLSLAILGE